MDDRRTAEFEHLRPHLRSVAYRMLGSLGEADDAVQETWLRFARSDTAGVQNLSGWLTTVVSRVCLDLLRARTARREVPLEPRLPDPIITAIDQVDPEQHALLADSIGLALLVVLDTLAPTERLAFVLHDIFAVPFAEIAAVLDRSPAAAKQLASRARQRLRGASLDGHGPDTAHHREIVDAFLAASRAGDLNRLLQLLDPDVVLRADAGTGPLGPSRLVRGAEAVAAQASSYAHLARFARPVLVNGAPGLLAVVNGEPISLLCMTVRGGRIAELDILADPDRLRRLAASVTGVPGS